MRAHVVDILDGDDSGHGMDHIDRVEALTMRFSGHYAGLIDADIARLAALLRDVDDYKLVGKENAATLTNATRIMEVTGIDSQDQLAVRAVISNMGYSKSLRGIRPESLEGKVVSDADMCDAIGVNGVVRCLTYALSSKGSGTVFNSAIRPDVHIRAAKYTANGSAHDTDSFINHFFENS